MPSTVYGPSSPCLLTTPVLYRRTSQSKTMTGGVHLRGQCPTAAAPNPALAIAPPAQTKKRETGGVHQVAAHHDLETLRRRVAAWRAALIAESVAHAATLTPLSSTRQPRKRKTAGVVSVARRGKKKTGMASPAPQGKCA